MAPAPDEAAITGGQGVAYTFASTALTTLHGFISDEITLWRDKSQTLIENMDGDASSISKMILKVVDIVLTVAVPEKGVFVAIYKAAGAAMKSAQVGGDLATDGDADQLKEAGQAIRAFADEAILANGRLTQQLLSALKTALSQLRDPDSLQRLARHGPDDLEVLCDRLGVKHKKAEINQTRGHLRKQLEA